MADPYRWGEVPPQMALYLRERRRFREAMKSRADAIDRIRGSGMPLMDQLRAAGVPVLELDDLPYTPDFPKAH